MYSHLQDAEMDLPDLEKEIDMAFSPLLQLHGAYLMKKDYLVIILKKKMTLNYVFHMV